MPHPGGLSILKSIITLTNVKDVKMACTVRADIAIAGMRILAGIRFGLQETGRGLDT
jgi:hypothetical protein